MSGMKIYKGEFDKQLELLLAPQIKAGFPSRSTAEWMATVWRMPESTTEI